MDCLSCKSACYGFDHTSDEVRVDVSMLKKQKENVRPQIYLPTYIELHKQRMQRQRTKEESKVLEQHRDNAKGKRQDEEEGSIGGSTSTEEGSSAGSTTTEVDIDQAASEAAAIAKAREERAQQQHEAARQEAFRLEAFRLEAERDASVKAQQEHEAARRSMMEAQQHEQQRAAAQHKVITWCKANGFSDMHTKKRTFVPLSSAKIPLHEAVKQNNAEIVGLFVQLGVDKEVKNSKGKTALEVATALNKDGSLHNIVALLT